MTLNRRETCHSPSTTTSPFTTLRGGSSNPRGTWWSQRPVQRCAGGAELHRRTGRAVRRAHAWSDRTLAGGAHRWFLPDHRRRVRDGGSDVTAGANVSKRHRRICSEAFSSRSSAAGGEGRHPLGVGTKNAARRRVNDAVISSAPGCPALVRRSAFRWPTTAAAAPSMLRSIRAARCGGTSPE
jgi:hypothetical protein